MDGERKNGEHNGPANQCDDVKQLKVEMKELKKYVGDIHYQVKEQGEELKDMKEFQGGTKVYVAEIKEQLGRMEDRLFTFMGNLVQNLTQKEESLANTSAKLTTHKWDKALGTLKEVLKYGIAAAAGYIASKGGK